MGLANNGYDLYLSQGVGALYYDFGRAHHDLTGGFLEHLISVSVVVTIIPKLCFLTVVYFVYHVYSLTIHLLSRTASMPTKHILSDMFSK